jgi:hypothetical protein
MTEPPARGDEVREVVRWQWLRETAALILAQTAGMLAVAVAVVGVVYSAFEPLITRCPGCAQAHAQLVLYLLAAAAAVPLLAFTAVALARRPSPAVRRAAWLTVHVLAVAALIALAAAEYALLTRWLAPSFSLSWLGGARLPAVITTVVALAVTAAYFLALRLVEEPRSQAPEERQEDNVGWGE